MSRLFSIEHPGLFAIACVLALATAALALARRPWIPRLALAFAAGGLLLLACAAGGLTWHRPAESEVAVMVDLSPSTRGAAYRDPRVLDGRIRQLLGASSFRLIYFAQQNTSTPPAGTPLPDLPAEFTRFEPPPAPAVVLFSDARFEPPSAAPPTFVVADPNLDRPGDAAVTHLHQRGRDLAATIANGGDARSLALSGSTATTRSTLTIDGGSVTITRPLASDATGTSTARLNAADRWPENDALTLPLLPPARTQRWLVSARPAPSPAWQAMKADALPTDPAAYLAPSLIVLDNVAAADLSDAKLRLLEQYVRDLGGALVITGGDRAFAPGFYAGTPLESLSPLASVPPAPAVHWVLLADASGSMSQAAGDATRWQRAASAITRLLPQLPPADPVSVGSFAGNLTWWSTGKPARETAARPLPPADVTPNGPTNLAAALERVAREVDGQLPTELLVVSDADVTIDQPDALAKALQAKRVRLHLLAIGEGSGLETLRRLSASTGGTLRTQLDPARWAGEVRQLLAGASPPRLLDTPITVTFAGDLSGLPARTAAPWNRTWLKSAATELAHGDAPDGRVPLGARWTVGADGAVTAFGFTPTPAELEAIATHVARPPRDPRFTVTWDAGARLRVRVDAAGQPSNGLSLRLELTPPDGPVSVYDIPQVAPGRYEITLPAPRTPTFAAVRSDRVIDRAALPGRFAPEFDAIGNDYDAMRRLASQTGGRVIDPAWTKALDVPFPTRVVALTSWLTLAGGLFLVAALARWRFA